MDKPVEQIPINAAATMEAAVSAVPDSGSPSEVVADEKLSVRHRIERVGPLQRVFRWIGEHRHPNKITTDRLGVGLAAGVVHRIDPLLGTAIFGLEALLDWVDGAAARAAGLQTREGEFLDPLIDKIVNNMLLIELAIAGGDPAVICAAVANATMDVISQRQRGPLTEQLRKGYQAVTHPESCTAPDAVSTLRANVWGKLKCALQNVGVAALMLDNRIAFFTSIGLAMILGAKGMHTLHSLKKATHV